MENDAAGFAMQEMKPRFDRLAGRHENGAAPVAVSAYQLFQTPVPIAAQLAALLGLKPSARVLEPSAGLGRLIDAILHPIQMPIAPAEEAEGINGGSEGGRVEVVAVEMEPVLCRHLYENYDSCNGEKTLYQRDFLTMTPTETGLFDAIIMNPPFHMRSDIKHILHALTFLKPEGKLAAICMEGPHREKALRPLASKWISLDPAAFKETGTHVQTAMLLIEMTAGTDSGHGQSWRAPQNLIQVL
jgi:SAM-dependent methyltransferase